MYGGVMVSAADNVTFIALILTYTAPLFDRKPLNRKSRLCTGSILSPDWVITAAHCVMRNDDPPVPKLSQITLGFHRKYKTRASKIYIHPNYTHKGGADIALLMTEARLPLGTESGLSALGLPAMKFAGSRKPCTIYGYGEKNSYDSLSVVTLSKITVSPMSANDCPKIFVYQMDPICYIAHGGVGPCMGDSGGPLLCSNEILAGILSRGLFHTKCGRGHPLILYEDVYVFKAWIVNTIRPTEKMTRYFLAPTDAVASLRSNPGIVISVLIIFYVFPSFLVNNVCIESPSYRISGA
ncbi:unnamed protein product [Bemisia tabaci]|uniref:Peptidase S1 domain-containing protein n=1 Tax=Bemisia tabaci TaxID=7038 RepID=A0A9P0AFK7_BEMTA|nr:unnamed protein product [Bemisia tabaci]